VLDEEGKHSVPTLSPDIAFEKLVTELESHKKQFNVLKSHLNHSKLIDTLNKKPKILILNCHGDWDKDDKITCFWFEKEEQPSLVHKYEQ
jgi:hypothetical protein